MALAIVATACLLPSAARAAQLEVRADFDGDGLHDHATLDRIQPSLLRIWLSTTRTTVVVRSASPVTAVAAADLDGDRRAELIAIAPDAALEVWTGARHGFRPVQPRAVPPDGLVPVYPRRVDDGPASDLPAGSDLEVPVPSAELPWARRDVPAYRCRRAPVPPSRSGSVQPALLRGPRPPPPPAF
jgi:hypothetical protein